VPERPSFDAGKHKRVRTRWKVRQVQADLLGEWNWDTHRAASGLGRPRKEPATHFNQRLDDIDPAVKEPEARHSKTRQLAPPKSGERAHEDERSVAWRDGVGQPPDLLR
jgi:hypothetical protein